VGEVALGQVKKCNYASVSSKIKRVCDYKSFWERQMTRMIRLINDEWEYVESSVGLELWMYLFLLKIVFRVTESV